MTKKLNFKAKKSQVLSKILCGLGEFCAYVFFNFMIYLIMYFIHGGVSKALFLTIVLITIIISFIGGFKFIKEPFTFWGGFQSFGKAMSFIVNSIILSVVYIIVVGLVNITARIFRKRFLQYGVLPLHKTYWHHINLGTKAKKEYYKMY